MCVLKIEQLSVQFHNHQDPAEAVRNLSLTVHSGEIVGMVGASGSGKSTAMKAVMGLLPETAEVRFQELLLHGKAAMIFQNPSASLNPSLTVGRQIYETIRTHRKISRKEAWQQTGKLLSMVGIRQVKHCFRQYPFELSGGMKQRIVIAIALACEPGLLIADEPTTALDATISQQILNLIRRIAEETGTAVLLVTHDVSVAKQLCKRIVVMKDGVAVEEGETRQIVREPRQDYTKELLTYSGLHKKAEPYQGNNRPLLRVEQVSHSYGKAGLLKRQKRLEAVCDVSFQIREGEMYGLVGESGSGKTTLAGIAAGLYPSETGGAYFRDESADLKQTCGKHKVQMVFQHPYASLNSRFTVDQILSEPLMIYPLSAEQKMNRILDILALVGLKPSDRGKYPAQFSGGQQQRIAIARALIGEPELIIFDEPVTSLDTVIQMQILELIKEVQLRSRLSSLFISHDMRVIRFLSQSMGVMYRGHLVESGDTALLCRDPWHPYTRELLKASLTDSPLKRYRKRITQAEEESTGGCIYASRCGYRMPCCRMEKPERYPFLNREVACFLYSEQHSGKRSPDYQMTTQI